MKFIFAVLMAFASSATANSPCASYFENQGDRELNEYINELNSLGWGAVRPKSEWRAFVAEGGGSLLSGRRGYVIFRSRYSRDGRRMPYLHAEGTFVSVTIDPASNLSVIKIRFASGTEVFIPEREFEIDFVGQNISDTTL